MWIVRTVFEFGAKMRLFRTIGFQVDTEQYKTLYQHSKAWAQLIRPTRIFRQRAIGCAMVASGATFIRLAPTYLILLEFYKVRNGLPPTSNILMRAFYIRCLYSQVQDSFNWQLVSMLLKLIKEIDWQVGKPLFELRNTKYIFTVKNRFSRKTSFEGKNGKDECIMYAARET